MGGKFDVSLSMLQPRKETQMGKFLNAKELRKGISQRKAQKPVSATYYNKSKRRKAFNIGGVRKDGTV